MTFPRRNKEIHLINKTAGFTNHSEFHSSSLLQSAICCRRVRLLSINCFFPTRPQPLPYALSTFRRCPMHLPMPTVWTPPPALSALSPRSSRIGLSFPILPELSVRTPTLPSGSQRVPSGSGTARRGREVDAGAERCTPRAVPPPDAAVPQMSHFGGCWCEGKNPTFISDTGRRNVFILGSGTKGCARSPRARVGAEVTRRLFLL